MNRIRKSFKALFEIIRNPWLLNKVLSEDTVWNKYLLKNYRLSSLPVVDLLDLSPGFSEKIDNYSFLDGGSLPTDIALLKTLCRRFDNCSYFEIGTWRGESVANVAEIASECYTLNLSAQEMESMGLDRRYSEQIGIYSRNIKNIHHLDGNSSQYDFSALNKTFDLLFIDGDHRYNSVKSDTQKIFSSLVHQSSIVVWHDCAYTPEKPRPEVIAAILDGVPPEFRQNIYHISNTLCAVFIRQHFTTRNLISPGLPDKSFRVSIESNRI